MIINQVKKYCISILESEPCSRLPFHNLTHTKEVVKNIKIIAGRLGWDKIKQEPIVIAGWFHDVGHSICYQGHEEESQNIAEEFLKRLDYPSVKLATVLTCIAATKIPQNPQSKAEEIICDADIMHIGTPHFFYRKILLRREWELVLGKTYSDKEWHHMNYDFLKSGCFFTNCEKNNLEKGRQENLLKVKEILNYYE